MSRRPEVRPTLRSAAELLALTGLAITQPLLDLFGNAKETRWKRFSSPGRRSVVTATSDP